MRFVSNVTEEELVLGKVYFFDTSYTSKGVFVGYTEDNFLAFTALEINGDDYTVFDGLVIFDQNMDLIWYMEENLN